MVLNGGTGCFIVSLAASPSILGSIGCNVYENRFEPD